MQNTAGSSFNPFGNGYWNKYKRSLTKYKSMQYPDIRPYLPYSQKLTAKLRRDGGNMFRHQMETLAILLEYGYIEPVLLKAALIHDLVEDGEEVGFNAFDEITEIDEDGAAVLALVREVSQRLINGVKESKSEFLLRVMRLGSEQAKILKLADRISNISALQMAGNQMFILRYSTETRKCILPYADKINPAMALELKNRIDLILKTIENEHTT
jgi:GTP pyrophosphokinase